MINFEYLEPKSVEEAIDYLKKYGDEAKIKAAGLSLLLLLKQGFFAPKYLVNINGLDSLNYIKLDKDSNLLLGALTTHRAIELSKIIRENYSVLSTMEKDLGDGRTWLLGEQFTLADINLMPFVARLGFLGLLDIWIAGRPLVQSWRERALARPSFASGVTDHFKPGEVEEMKDFGAKIKDQVAERYAEYLVQFPNT